jgi:hypothetical protein
MAAQVAAAQTRNGGAADAGDLRRRSSVQVNLWVGNLSF